MGMMAGAGAMTNHPIPENDDREFPLNGSCATCHKDGRNRKLLKCSLCKTVAYCDAKCQKVQFLLDPMFGRSADDRSGVQGDWSRHKRTCKWIKGARFVDSVSSIISFWAAFA